VRIASILTHRDSPYKSWVGRMTSAQARATCVIATQKTRSAQSLLARSKPLSLVDAKGLSGLQRSRTDA
jgi:hypothetical protein